MHIFSARKPLSPDQWDLEALGLEVMITSDGQVLVLLIRYYSLEPVKIEGDHLFFSLEELINETENHYQIPRN